MKHLRRSTLVLVLALGVLSSHLRAEPAASVESTGSIERAVFDQWLDRGPQYLLSQTVPMPVTHERRFVGFRVSMWFPGHPDVTEGAVKLGDVVQRVNGRSVEHPDQFLYVWKQLRGARAVVIDGLREGRPWKATLSVIDPPASSPVDVPAPTPGAAPSEPASGTP